MRVDLIVEDSIRKVADHAVLEAARDERVKGFFDITDQIASFEWDMQEVKDQHLVLAREMNSLVDVTRTLDLETSAPVTISN